MNLCQYFPIKNITDEEMTTVSFDCNGHLSGYYHYTFIIIPSSLLIWEFWVIFRWSLMVYVVIIQYNAGTCIVNVLYQKIWLPNVNSDGPPISTKRTITSHILKGY
jgi:hypothetical protein